MWGILQITYERTTEVKRERLDAITHEYELFKMKPEERINQMQTRLPQTISHMRTLGKTFSNDELVIKILRSINNSWKPKLIAICESKMKNTTRRRGKALHLKLLTRRRGKTLHLKLQKINIWNHKMKTMKVRLINS